jgi:hypothetical protein
MFVCSTEKSVNSSKTKKSGWVLLTAAAWRSCGGRALDVCVLQSPIYGTEVGREHALSRTSTERILHAPHGDIGAQPPLRARSCRSSRPLSNPADRSPTTAHTRLSSDPPWKASQSSRRKRFDPLDAWILVRRPSIVLRVGLGAH